MTGRSSIKDKADAEAARAEAENPDEPETEQEQSEPVESEPVNPDAEPDEEAEEAAEAEAADEQAAAPADARSDAETQKLFERAVGAFRAKLADVFGVPDVEPSAVPGVIGFLIPGATEQKPHENFTRCSTCNGYGTVLTGSIKAGEETRPCPDGRCKGRGYWERMTAPPQPQPFAPVGGVTGPTAFAEPSNGAGEFAEAPTWMGDPNLSAGPTP